MKPWREDASGPAALASVAIHAAVIAWALTPLARAPAPPVVRTISVTLLDAPAPVVATVAPPSPRRARATARLPVAPPAPSTPPARPAEAPVREAPAPVALEATAAGARASVIAAAVDTRHGSAHEPTALAASAVAAPSVGLPGAAPARTAVTLLERPLPGYPSMSRRLRETGRVLLDILVGVDGRAQAVTVLESSGHVRLDDAAIDAVRRWRFAPARESGTAVVAHVQVPVVFELDGGGRAGASPTAAT